VSFFGWQPEDLPIETVDWEHRADYIRERSQRHPGDLDLEPEWANEAVFDRNRGIEAPDRASKTGKSVRIVGYSTGSGVHLVVILVPKDFDQLGDWWGADAWKASDTDIRHYEKEG
jgi:hypothetical protein